MIEILKNILPVHCAQALVDIGKVKHYQNGAYFIRAGQVPKKFGFIGKGIFRYVYINNDGVEYTKGIIQEFGFISAYSAMISQEASHFYIEALEDAEILEISYAQWQILREKDSYWDKFLIKLLEKAFTKKEKRERDFLLLDAPTRYINFLKEYPNLQERIKLNIVASYLGIQPESLSRIRKKINN